MKPRPDHPRHLDVAGFAKGGVRLQGDIPLDALPRLQDLLHADARLGATSLPLHWQADGQAREQRGAAPQTWLHLQADTVLSLVCQRCLNAVVTPVHVKRSFRFVPDEETAEALDAEIDDDVLALPRSLDLQQLVEDELLLALPLVPRHDTCPQPLAPATVDEPFEEKPVNPFAALAALKQGDHRH